jgi:hypothetical protein
MTPLANIIVSRLAPDFPLKALQFYYVLLMIAVSPFLRYYREAWTLHLKR